MYQNIFVVKIKRREGIVRKYKYLCMYIVLYYVLICFKSYRVLCVSCYMIL